MAKARVKLIMTAILEVEIDPAKVFDLDEFPKDIKSLISTAKAFGAPMGLVEAAETANLRQKKHMVNKIKNHFGTNLSGKVFALWGLSFKPNTDDMREAPSLIIIDELLKAGAKIQAYDPIAMENTRQIIGDKINFCETYYQALEGASALVLVTEWNEFKQPDWTEVKRLLKEPIVFDGRNIFDPKQLSDYGIKYFGIGRTHK